MSADIHQRIAEIQSKIQQFSLDLSSWAQQEESFLNAEISRHNDVTDDYDNCIQTLSSRRNDSSLRYDDAVRQVAAYEAEIAQIQQEIDQHDNSSQNLCTEIDQLKNLSVELQARLQTLKAQKYLRLNALQEQLAYKRRLVQKYEIALGLKIQSTDGCGTRLEYHGLSPMLAYTLYLHPARVEDYSLILPRTKEFELAYLAKGMVHAFIASMYTEHRRVYPQPQAIHPATTTHSHLIFGNLHQSQDAMSSIRKSIPSSLVQPQYQQPQYQQSQYQQQHQQQQQQQQQHQQHQQQE